MIKTLAAQIKEYKAASILTPLCMIGEVIMETLIPLMMASIIDYGVEKGDMAHIIKMGVIMVLIAFCGLLFGGAGGVMAAKASAGFAKNLRKAMFENIQTFSFSNIDRFSTSGLITRLTTDVTNLQNAYQMLLRMAMRAPFTLIFAMAMSFFINVKLASVYLVAVLFLSAIVGFLMSRAHKYFRQVFEKYDALNESVQENIGACREVKAYVREDYETQRFNKASKNIYDMFIKAERHVVLVMPIMMMTVYSCIVIISRQGAMMIVGEQLRTGELMSLLTYCLNILMHLLMLSFIVVMITMSQASAKRICEVINEDSDLKQCEDPVKDMKDGSISFDHVTFRYFERSERPVLSDVTLDIASGETIGIIGGTGSAKTSLINLISRLYDVNEGCVKVSGVDVREYDMAYLRDQVSVVLQKNVLFSGSIIENLRWGNENATVQECIEACRMACADEFIEKMPEKYESHVEQGGTNFSGGQRQRLCIARALMKKPKILILDDSTSAVDTATDSKIRNSFKTYIPGTTKIIIAQRIASVMDADRIVVMDEGKINGVGTHEELIKTNDIYREVCQLQGILIE